MGKRGPKGRSDELARLLGNPSHRRLNPPHPPATAPLMAATGESPLGWLTRHEPPELTATRSPKARSKRVAPLPEPAPVPRRPIAPGSRVRKAHRDGGA
jgi:hypothetical protein